MRKFLLIAAAACLLTYPLAAVERWEDPNPDDGITEADAWAVTGAADGETNGWREIGYPGSGASGEWELAIVEHRNWFLDIHAALSEWNEDINGDGTIDIRHPDYDEIMWCLVFANDNLNFCEKWLWEVINCAEVRNQQARSFVSLAYGCLDAEDWEGAYTQASKAYDKLDLRAVQEDRAARDFDNATGWLNDAEMLLWEEGE